MLPNQAFKDLLSGLCAPEVEFMDFGAALAAHGHVRGRKTLDVWARPTRGNELARFAHWPYSVTARYQPSQLIRQIVEGKRVTVQPRG